MLADAVTLGRAAHVKLYDICTITAFVPYRTTLRFPEIALMCLVGTLVILWLFRNPAGMRGWAVYHA